MHFAESIEQYRAVTKIGFGVSGAKIKMYFNKII